MVTWQIVIGCGCPCFTIQISPKSWKIPLDLYISPIFLNGLKQPLCYSLSQLCGLIVFNWQFCSSALGFPMLLWSHGSWDWIHCRFDWDARTTRLLTTSYSVPAFSLHGASVWSFFMWRPSRTSWLLIWWLGFPESTREGCKNILRLWVASVAIASSSLNFSFSSVWSAMKSIEWNTHFRSCIVHL